MVIHGDGHIILAGQLPGSFHCAGDFAVFLQGNVFGNSCGGVDVPTVVDVLVTVVPLDNRGVMDRNLLKGMLH
jgi:hypothetical protein